MPFVRVLVLPEKSVPILQDHAIEGIILWFSRSAQFMKQEMNIEFSKHWTRRGVLGVGMLVGSSLLTKGFSGEEVASDGAKDERFLRVISHNIYWGQGSNFRTDQPPSPRREVLKGLAKLYLDYGADVVSLQEIQSAEAAAAMGQELGMDFVYQEGGGFKQYGGAVFSKWPLRALPMDDVAPGRILIRTEIAMPETKPFQIMNMHLPSGRQLGPQEGARKRLEDATAAAGRADLLIGDFNQRVNASHAPMLEEKGYALLWPENINDNEGTPLVNAERVIDQGWIRKELAKDVVEFIYVPIRDPRMQLTPDDGGKERLSDHPAMMLTLRWH